MTYEKIEAAKHVADGPAIATAAATFFGLLPEATALLSFIWIAIRIYETATVQKLIERLRNKQ